MSVSYWQRQNGATKACDVVIVGAGISGLSVAYWMKKEDPSLDICVLDKGGLGSGATGRNAGFITCGSVEHYNRLVKTYGENKALELWRFSELNLELLRWEIFSKDPSSLGFESKGSFSLASENNEFAELKEVASLMARQKIPVEVLTGSEVEKRVVAINFVGGIKYISDASVHPVYLLERIKQLAQVTVTRAEVFAVEEQDNDRRVKTSQGDFRAPLVVLATNGYLPLLHSYFDDKIAATRGQILMMEPVPAFMEGPCYANFVLDYFRQLPSGELLIGGFRQLEKETEVGYSDHITPTIQSALSDFVKRYLPAYQNKKVLHRWAGIMGFSRDGQPFVGSLPEDPQVFFLGGFTAHGLGLAFHTGKCLVDLVYGRSFPEFLSSRRF